MAGGLGFWGTMAYRFHFISGYENPRNHLYIHDQDIVQIENDSWRSVWESAPFHVFKELFYANFGDEEEIQCFAVTPFVFILTNSRGDILGSFDVKEKLGKYVLPPRSIQWLFSTSKL